jgi:hypothetical protein
MSGYPSVTRLSDTELHGLRVVEAGGRWNLLLEEGSLIPIPGARYMKVNEFAKDGVRKTRRYGPWIEVDGTIAREDPELLRWCRQNCKGELPSGTFRFSPREWDERSEDFLPIPFLPERDHPDPTIRKLAEAELFRRIAEHQMRASRDRRDRLVRTATKDGWSRRDLAKLLDISFARIQQLVRDE